MTTPPPIQVSTNAMLFSLGAIPPRPAYGQPLRPMVRPMPPPGAPTPVVAPSPPGARPAQQPQPMPSNVATAPAQRPPQPPATANNLVAPMQNMHIQQQQPGAQVKIIYTSILP